MTDVDEELVARARARIGALLAGKYRIDAVLGVGGMAAVYSATHRNGRRLAVKVLHPELSLRAELRRRFLREGQAANAVKHPGAVVVVDDDVAEDGAAFLVMELLEGDSLEQLWQANGRRLNPRTVLAIARELCDVLDAAHRAGVVHRDIKPANVFVTTSGQLKVLDFGIARLHDGVSPKLTETGVVFGTPAFMAPEQASGRASRVDELTDIWSIGATMFSLLTGQSVHLGETSQHIVMLAATQPPRSLASVLPDARPELVAVVDRALAFDKAARWPSAAAMRDAIIEASRTLYGEPTPRIIDATFVVHRKAISTPIEALTITVPSSDALPDLSGTTTAEPVSTIAAKRASPARRRVFAAFAAFVGVAAIAGAITLNASRLRGARSEAVASGTMSVAASAPDVSMALPPSAVPSSESAPSAAEPVTSAPRAATAPVKTSRPITRSPTNPAPTSHSRSNCNPPFFLDPSGKKIWKVDCL